MKRYSLFFLALSACLLWVAACKEPVITEGILPLREPATADPTGGNWRTLMLTSASEVTVPQPADVNSESYQRELAVIKNGVLGLQPEQLTAISYWADGGVLRWNQIARQLISKYNTLPANNESTGQYAPFDATNPSTNATFAARIFALLSVAQYDALVVAWRAKYQYNRPSLSQQGVQTQVPVADVPSYPSEDAAIAEASNQVLAYFFPNEAAWLKTKSAEHKQSRIWAGVNVTSDLKAGEDLAASVAAKVLAYAKNDRFAAAFDLNSTWLTKRANAPYDTKWTSLEVPARPPVLPLFGAVKTWYDSTTIARNAPQAPPLTSSTDFQKALTEVRDIANTRTREQFRIASYWDDGVGTYTMPGHWNLITEDYVRQGRQNELRTARTYALMNRALEDAAIVSWQTKYKYFVPRPSQVDPTIKTATVIPNSPSYIAEHAAFAAAASTVLTYLFPDQSTTLTKQANEAILSRLYGGVHYRFDIDEGAKTGNSIGNLAVEWAKADGAK